jgi:hypothetical protein
VCCEAMMHCVDTSGAGRSARIMLIQNQHFTYLYEPIWLIEGDPGALPRLRINSFTSGTTLVPVCLCK